jgi:hypothetical protein
MYGQLWRGEEGVSFYAHHKGSKKSIHKISIKNDFFTKNGGEGSGAMEGGYSPKNIRGQEIIFKKFKIKASSNSFQ